jgi:Flp pilus assembly pilin Flp
MFNDAFQTVSCKTFLTVRRFLHDRRGDDFAEKAVIIVVIVLAGVAVFMAFGQKIVSMVNTVIAGM